MGIIACPRIFCSAAPILSGADIRVMNIEIRKGVFRVLNGANLFHDLLKLTNGRNILLLLICPFLVIISAVITGRGRNRVANLFNVENNAERYAVVEHSLIIWFFPYIVFLYVLVRLALVHFVEVVSIKAAGAP